MKVPGGKVVNPITEEYGHIVELGEPMWAVVRWFLAQGMAIQTVAQRTSMPPEIVQQIAKCG